MVALSDKYIVGLAAEMLRDKGIISSHTTTAAMGRDERSALAIVPLASDGSTRRFWRFSLEKKALAIAVAPLTPSETECRESRAAWYIGNHLFKNRCAVPELYGWNEESGLLLFEDLGDQRLHGIVAGEDAAEPEQVREQYKEVVRQLAAMQVRGGRGFDPSWCWDGGCYDKDVMLKKESGYFLQAFWTDFLGEPVPGGIDEEFVHLAERAAEAPNGYFLHRDFQSRNIMLTDSRPRFIDFQGGRLGPLGYDLASLLIDPYCALSSSLQEDLFDEYLREIKKYIDLDSAVFHEEFTLLALQRNLQIIGAFSFLSRVRRKTFFAKYLKPALEAAEHRMVDPVFSGLPLLKKMVTQGLRCIEQL
ncbi:aminoglycoside phosphotransferase family protein [Desulforhopalus sp. IMCC35007]|uniref:aminoglycoside phosphotransferase family protein n=1 Tax=Desulforhopalus sp. IMCC35007 TaxID=2569543 RepID=UPI0010ADB920|nr:phosphotransferase [Desulforhopalus sp. IMCC35007]TKB09407.1 aminoglycoside phosphotransferase [Desulforhopalus sp. IMCC35007]